LAADAFDEASRRLRAALAPVVDRVLHRHGRPPVFLDEPRSARAVWFTLPDEHGAPLVLVAAHADGVDFLLGRRGFLHVRDTASTSHDGLVAWFEDVLDGALAGGLDVHDDGSASLRTASGQIRLSG
jgi:hypothetical protein